MKNGNIIIGGIGKNIINILDRLDKSWKITVIDKNKKRLLDLLDIRKNITTIEGDIANIQILNKANIDKANVLIISTDDDSLNREISLTIRSLYPELKIFSIMKEVKNRVEFNENSIEVVEIAPIISNLILNKIENRVSIATNIGLGKGEIVEVTLSGTSKIIGKSLRDIHPKEWVVGAIYRNNELILPHGDTIFKENDSLLIISDPKKINYIAESISVGDYRFPLQFGNNIMVILYPFSNWKTTVDEANYVFQNFHAKEINFYLLNYNQKIAFNEDLKKESILYIKTILKNRESFVKIFTENYEISQIKEFYDSGNYGLVIIPDEKFSFLNKLGKKTVTTLFLDFITSPLLISKGKLPYQNILISDREIKSPLKGIEIAINISKKGNSKLTSIFIKEPEFSNSSIEITESNKIKKEQIKLMCEKYKSDLINSIDIEGNPIREIKKVAKNYDLLIIAQKNNNQSTFFHPSENQYLMHKSKTSVLVYNFCEEI
ncbi:NAD-binding protein [bacterium]|nr:NAD-binding protein [bacterium]